MRINRIMVVVILSVFVAILGVGLRPVEAAETQAEDSTAVELKNELSAKNIKISVAEAVKIAEEKNKGTVVGFRLRRMKFNVIGYSIIVLKNDPPALVVNIINATTGEIVSESTIDKYPIVPAVK